MSRVAADNGNGVVYCYTIGYRPVSLLRSKHESAAIVGEDIILPRGITRFALMRWANPHCTRHNTIHRNTQKPVMWREADSLSYRSQAIS